ncbi:MAG: tetratricopeptide repeat protein [Planctomycetota bacterium]
MSKLNFLIFLFFLIGFSILQPASAFAQQSDEDAARALAQTAFNAQKSGEYDFAARQWEKLITDFPESQILDKAYFNLGICLTRSYQFDKATEALETVIPKLEDGDPQKSNAKFFLGFCQFRQGQSLKIESGEADQAKGKLLIQTATRTFEDLIQGDPDFVDLDQVYYQQGEAFTELGQTSKAYQSYLKVLDCPKKTMRLEGLYALADTCEKLTNFADALQYYQQYLSESEAAGGTPSDDVIRWRAGMSLMELANQDEATEQKEAAFEKLNQAVESFQKILSRPADARDESWTEVADNARLDLAGCFRRLGQYDKAAELLEQISEDPDSAFAKQAVANAGRNYLDAGNLEKAESFLNRAIDQSSQYSDQAALWLTQAYLKRKQPQKAYDVSSRRLADSATKNISLLMDQAEAAYQIPEKLVESATLFESIATRYPESKLAPAALLNAIYSYLDLENLEKTVKLASDFQAKYADSQYMVDVLELKAEANLLDENFEDAIAGFNALAAGYPDNPKISFWNLRRGIAHYLKAEYRKTIEVVEPEVDGLQDKDRLAAAAFWVGSSYFQEGLFDKAIAQFKKSESASTTWNRADENLLMWTRALLGLDKQDLALEIAEKMGTDFPDSPKLADLNFYLGDSFYKAKDYPNAFSKFERIITGYRGTRFEPASIYQAALCQARLGKTTESEALFSDLMTRFPEHELAKEAKIDRGSMRLKSGDAVSSIADLKEFLATNPPPADRNDAQYKIGLAQIELKQWDDAIETLSGLVKRAKQENSNRLDNFLYDLGWAYRYRKISEPDSEDLSSEQFETIVRLVPESKLVGEASFHVGSAAYDAQDFVSAITHFKRSFESETSDSVREKAGYRLGWSYYKLEKYEDAAESFQSQVDAFPGGPLQADGLFMVGESYFRSDQYVVATDAYLNAKSAVDQSDEIQPIIKSLVRLHGAQAANKSKRFESAEILASELIGMTKDVSLQQDAWLELGYAQQGLGNLDKAVEAWKKAAKNLGETGARATCMVGDYHFSKQEFAEAINYYKLVFFGFGGPDADAEIKSWQAYAVYETARCYFVRIRDAEPELQTKYKTEAIRWFEYLVKNYPQDKLAKDAADQLTKLKSAG